MELYDPTTIEIDPELLAQLRQMSEAMRPLTTEAVVQYFRMRERELSPESYTFWVQERVKVRTLLYNVLLTHPGLHRDLLSWYMTRQERKGGLWRIFLLEMLAHNEALCWERKWPNNKPLIGYCLAQALPGSGRPASPLHAKPTNLQVKNFPPVVKACSKELVEYLEHPEKYSEPPRVLDIMKRLLNNGG